MHHLDAGFGFEKFACHVSCRTVTAGGIVELVGVCLAVGNQIFDGLDTGTLLKFRRDDKHIERAR